MHGRPAERRVPEPAAKRYAASNQPPLAVAVAVVSILLPALILRD